MCSFGESPDEVVEVLNIVPLQGPSELSRRPVKRRFPRLRKKSTAAQEFWAGRYG